MPRKTLKPREKRGFPPPDYRYQSPIVSRLVNKINFEGKRSHSEMIVYGAMDLVKEKIKEEPLQVFLRAIESVRPLLEVRPRRVGGATYQVPMEVPMDRSVTLALQWILNAARAKTGRPMVERLCEEILAASKKEGTAFKKREDTHRMAEANKAFAHYRW
ncbi:MAG: 30S ribosomal protein S7 [Elusimicrobia bacterium]|nr:30S ribosomal protein S7 [Elusimicrobiota bacterium]MBI3013036.1 30S ribosomal protein S7 [Elusimicrobiota bacterium]